MKRDLAFVLETSSKQKRKTALIGFIILVIIVGAGIAIMQTFTKNNVYANSLKETIYKEIYELTPPGLFYAGFVGGLFFVPIPHEIFFYLSIIKGNPIILALLMTNAGYFLSQMVNYFVGARFYKLIMFIVSKKKIYKARRFINKYGAFGVLIFNTLPLPAPLLTFALGMTKYNIYRLFLYTILGNVVKYGAIIGFVLLTT